MKDRAHIYERIAEQVVAAMESGKLAPWQRPWVAMGGGALPHNAVSGRSYRGANVLILWMAAESVGYDSPRWLTFKQAKDLGGSVRRGEHGTRVIFWKPTEYKDKATGEDRRGLILREYTVFNVAQCDGLPSWDAPRAPTLAGETNAEAERIISASPVPIHYGGDRACYSPSEDRISLPLREHFKSHAEFYTTAFHELGHSTGHASRLGRDGIAKFDFFGSHQYSREELVAEFCACFLAGHCGFERTTLDNSAAYLNTWIAKIKDEPRIVAEACQQAQKAADLILNAAEEASESEAA